VLITLLESISDIESKPTKPLLS